MQKNPTIIPVVALALIAQDGRILLQQRRKEAHFGGLWEFPGGKLEPGEGLAEALIREIAEELGVRVLPQDIEPVGFAHNDSQPHLILLYMCRKWQGEVQCLDGEALAWFDTAQMDGLEMPPLDYPLVKSLLRCI